MKINRLSLLNSLFNVLNENNQGDPYFILAEYFLEHYHELSRLNIYDVAADCFVSRSSIRRFCQAIGYENFVAFKDEFAQYDDQRASFQKHAGRENYRETLTQEINAMIAELDQRMNTAEVERLAERIHDAREVVFLTSSVGATSVAQFQHSMIFQNKVIRMVSDMYENIDFVKHLQKEDLLLVISGSGLFAAALRDYLRDNPAYKILFTLNRSHDFDDVYDTIYHLSAADRSQEAKSVYYTYGTIYVLDVLYSVYVKKYGDSQ